ncbi:MULTISPECIES: hypothetical protein [Roseobacteraceae]|uniref:hypothetical protein n=1 Tax=unclassified Salipiger TaxID=2640570 RepID=UPI00080AAC46|nr:MULTISPECIES: hypothetical protein [Roseobacteraceae]ANT63467.1 hypothetical protein AYJ57_23605 [Salipiger sp. CCB-MM3]MCA0997143.1 hypothetical protein [Alloyangia pacifica]NDW02375.1 hypothetical protein [Salipiger sp. PrR002]NDW59416.1 hypothetical protein [Salipiger sp. PrR004]
MIELLFVACLSTAPDTCSERSLVYTDVTPMACMMGAQPELARWVEEHPNFTVNRWRCRVVGEGDIEA